MPKYLPSYIDNVNALRPFSVIKLVALDLDGTLAPGPLEQKVQQSMRSLSHYGVRTTLATGRTYFGARGMCEKLNIRIGTPIILYNGSIVVKYGHERLLRRVVIKNDALVTVLETARSFSCEVLAYFCLDKGTILTPDGSLEERVEGWHFGSHASDRVKREFNGDVIHWINGIIKRGPEEPSAILIRLFSPDSIEAATECMRAIEGITVTRSSSEYLELRPSGSDKSVGLQCAAMELGLDKSHTLALGDNDNDAEMLAWSAIGVAIAGSSAAALANADFICRGETFAGAVELLSLVKYAHRYFPPQTPTSP